MLNRVLRRHNHKQLRQLITPAAHADLALGHGFEQSGLNLCRRAVNFVGQNQIGKNRPLAKLKLALGCDIDFTAGNIRRQQIRRKLNTVVLGVNAA